MIVYSFVQAVVVMACENHHVSDDMIMEPGLVMIFAHGVEQVTPYSLALHTVVQYTHIYNYICTISIPQPLTYHKPTSLTDILQIQSYRYLMVDDAMYLFSTYLIPPTCRHHISTVVVEDLMSCAPCWSVRTVKLENRRITNNYIFTLNNITFYILTRY